jgi:peptidoglycan/xylan/chitin deacetylase (PgdA/CDA1 family)
MNGGLILLYHRVGEAEVDPWSLCVSEANFEAHLEVLRSFRFVSLEELVTGRGSCAEGAVAITFDDGYAETAARAKPLLEKFEAPATFFLSSNWVGSEREFWWDELEELILGPGERSRDVRWNDGTRVRTWEVEPTVDRASPEARHWRAWSDPPPTKRHRLYREVWQEAHALPSVRREGLLRAIRLWAGEARARESHRCLDDAEVRLLSRSPMVSIGCHGRSHDSLSRLAPFEQKAELSDSRERLQALSGQPVASLSYPFGKPVDFDDVTVAAAKEVGFTAAVVNDSGVVTADSDAFRLPRIYVEDWDGARFAQALSSAWQG